MFNFDKRILYIILGAIILSRFVTAGSDTFVGLLLTLPAVIIAITFHEFAHAFVADKLGDDTPRSQGRLNLNPLSHIDPVGFLMLIIAGFGWGKPVQINPVKFDRRMSMEKAEALVSVAGPVMNFILAIIFTLIYAVLLKFNILINISFEVASAIVSIVFYSIVINVGLGLFNLIPLPPLDGSKILKIFLPVNAKRWFENNSQIFYIIFVVIWMTGIAGSIISPAIQYTYQGLINIVFKIMKMI